LPFLLLLLPFFVVFPVDEPLVRLLERERDADLPVLLLERERLLVLRLRPWLRERDLLLEPRLFDLEVLDLDLERERLFDRPFDLLLRDLLRLRPRDPLAPMLAG
jgi:hypothetical protein